MILYNSLWSVILDLIVVLIIASFAFLGYKRGFVRTLASMLTYVVSIISSYILSSMIAKSLVSLISPSLLSYVQTKATEIIGNNVSATASDIYDQIPYIMKFLVPFKDNVSIDATINNSVNQMSTVITNDFIIPTVEMMIRSIIFIALFFVILIILKFIVKRLSFINHIPVIGGINVVLGLVLGLVQALIVLVILVNVAYLAIGLSTNSLMFLNTDVVNNSLLFKKVYDLILSVF